MYALSGAATTTSQPCASWILMVYLAARRFEETMEHNRFVEDREESEIYISIYIYTMQLLQPVTRSESLMVTNYKLNLYMEVA